MRVAIIPARGGSKRIPKKNIKEFRGKPIIYYSIQAAIESKLFDKVIVSTDDEKIRNIALSYGAEVPWLRTKRNSNDFASVVDVVKECLENFNSEGLAVDYICCIFATAPFVTSRRLRSSLDRMMKEGKDAIFPVVEYSYPIQRSLEVGDDGNIGMVWKEHLLSRSQDLKPRYHDAGQFYWAKVENVLNENTLFLKNSICEIISPKLCQDIDTMDDWLLAELKFEAFHAKDPY